MIKSIFSYHCIVVTLIYREADNSLINLDVMFDFKGELKTLDLAHLSPSFLYTQLVLPTT